MPAKKKNVNVKVNNKADAVVEISQTTGDDSAPVTPADSVTVELIPAVPAPIPTPVIRPDIVDNAPSGIAPNVIQVRTPKGYLLFCFNPVENAIEVRDHRVLYRIPLDRFKRAAFDAVFGDGSAKLEVVAEEVQPPAEEVGAVGLTIAEEVA